ncbi:hypothetical protein AAY473_023797 [Plecturocebus cupreus]
MPCGDREESKSCSVAHVGMQWRNLGSRQLCSPGSSDSSASVSWVAGITTRSPYVAQAGLKLLSLSNPTTLASESAGITSVSHDAWPIVVFSFEIQTLLFSACFMIFLNGEEIAEARNPYKCIPFGLALEGLSGLETIVLLSPKLECSGAFSAHHNLCHLPGSSVIASALGKPSLKRCAVLTEDEGWKLEAAATAQGAPSKGRERVDAALSASWPTDREIPAEKHAVPGATLAGAVFAGTQRALPGAEIQDRRARLVPSPQGKQQLEALRTESSPGAATREEGNRRPQRKTTEKLHTGRRESKMATSSSSGLWLA